MRRRRPSQTSAVLALELGSPLCSSLTLRAELTRLSHLRASAFTTESFLEPHPTTSHLRTAHIAQITPSYDRCLLGIASTDGRVEIHEPLCPEIDDTNTQQQQQQQSSSSTLRLTLTSQSRLSSAAFFPTKQQDVIVTAAADTACLLAYDLNVCVQDTPTISARARGDSRKAFTDVMPLTWPTCAAVRPNQLALFDLRTRARHQVISAVHLPCSDPVLTAVNAPTTGNMGSDHDFLLFVAEGAQIIAYDRRKLPSGSSAIASSTSSTNPSSLVMGSTTNIKYCSPRFQKTIDNSLDNGFYYTNSNNTNNNIHSKLNSSSSSFSSPITIASTIITSNCPIPGAVSVCHLPLSKRVRYNWLRPPDGAPAGMFAFHATDGTFGVLDWAGEGKVTTLREVPPTKSHHSSSVVTNRTEDPALMPYGTMAAALSTAISSIPGTTTMRTPSMTTSNAWYIRRRRGDIFQAPDGRGWRALLPNVCSPGIRAVAFGPHLPTLLQFSIPSARDLDVACAHAVDGRWDNIIIGTTRNEVIALHSDMGQVVSDRDAQLQSDYEQHR